MLLHGHDLYSIVAKVDDTWEYLLLELSIRTYLTLLRGHTYMTLIDHESFVSLTRASITEDIRLLGIPDLSAEDTRLAVLNYTACP